MSERTSDRLRRFAGYFKDEWYSNFNGFYRVITTKGRPSPDLCNEEVEMVNVADTLGSLADRFDCETQAMESENAELRDLIREILADYRREVRPYRLDGFEKRYEHHAAKARDLGIEVVA